jgi:hypothetical protein
VQTLANVVWPALYLEEKLLSALSIGAGLTGEILVLRAALEVPWRRAIGTGFLMNAVSTVVGILLIPFLGLFWETMWEGFGGRYGATASWAVLLVLATAANTAIEIPFAWKVGRVPFGLRLAAWMFAANGVTVGLAFALVRLRPHEL